MHWGASDTKWKVKDIVSEDTAFLMEEQPEQKLRGGSCRKQLVCRVRAKEDWNGLRARGQLHPV
jgi:hypothetical protein